MQQIVKSQTPNPSHRNQCALISLASAAENLQRQEERENGGERNGDLQEVNSSSPPPLTISTSNNTNMRCRSSNTIIGTDDKAVKIFRNSEQDGSGSIANPHANDVIGGRGAAIQSHPGNEYYRLLIRSQKIEYVNSKPPSKKLIIHEIVQAITTQSPPGRFLKLDSKTEHYYPMSIHEAKKKTGQALREDAPKLKQMGNLSENHSIFQERKMLHSEMSQQDSLPYFISNEDPPYQHHHYYHELVGQQRTKRNRFGTGINNVCDEDVIVNLPILGLGLPSFSTPPSSSKHLSTQSSSLDGGRLLIQRTQNEYARLSALSDAIMILGSQNSIRNISESSLLSPHNSQTVPWPAAGMKNSRNLNSPSDFIKFQAQETRIHHLLSNASTKTHSTDTGTISNGEYFDNSFEATKDYLSAIRKRKRC